MLGIKPGVCTTELRAISTAPEFLKVKLGSIFFLVTFLKVFSLIEITFSGYFPSRLVRYSIGSGGGIDKMAT